MTCGGGGSEKTLTLHLSLQFFPVGKGIAPRPVTAKWICSVPYVGVICAGAYFPRIIPSQPLWIKVRGEKPTRYAAVDTQRPFRIGAILTCPDCENYVEGVRVVTNIPLDQIDDAHQSQETRRTWASFSSWPTSPVFDYAVIFELSDEDAAVANQDPYRYDSVPLCDLSTGSIRQSHTESLEPYLSVDVRNEMPDDATDDLTSPIVVVDPCACCDETPIVVFSKNKTLIMQSAP
jgi:hypothetical protein